MDLKKYIEDKKNFFWQRSHQETQCVDKINFLILEHLKLGLTFVVSHAFQRLKM